MAAGKRQQDHEREGRPAGQADADLEAAQREVAAGEEKLKTLQTKLEEHNARVAKAKKIEEAMDPLEETKRKLTARFKRILSDRPDSARQESGEAHASNGGITQAVEREPVRVEDSSKQYRELLQEASDVLLGILGAIYRAGRTKRELDELAAEADGASAPNTSMTVISDTPDFRCPVGVSSDVFSKLLELRALRLQTEDSIEAQLKLLLPLKEEIARDKAEGIGQALLKRHAKHLQARKEECREAAKRVTQLDEDYARLKEEEQWQQHVRSQAAEDLSKRK